jgi:cytochrome c oxidase accessory protein FixG
VSGDCIDCGLCVETCPTGIDIREGLKMECVGCAQCIDACDAVMEKIGKPKGLVRYSSQARIMGERGRLARVRVFIYPALLLVIGSIFGFLLLGKADTDVTFLRGLGVPFVEMPGGEVSNPLRLKIHNRAREAARYTVTVLDPAEARIILDENPIVVPPGGSVTKGLVVVLQADSYVDGKRDLTLRVSQGTVFSRDIRYRLLGPVRRRDSMMVPPPNTPAPPNPALPVGSMTPGMPANPRSLEGDRP